MKSTLSSGGLSSVVSRMKTASVIAAGGTPPPVKPPPFDPFAEARAAKAAKEKADADAVALRVERWRAWMVAHAREPPAAVASATGSAEGTTPARAGVARRIAQLTVLRQFPQRHASVGPTVPEGLTWLGLEPSWQALVQGRVGAEAATAAITEGDAVRRTLCVRVQFVLA